MLDEAEIGDFFAEHFTRSAWRLETLPAYDVESDGGDFQRWQAGATEPTWERKNVWLDVLRADTAAGRYNGRVKVMSPRVTDYERYACEWGYALNVEAGEDVRVLDLHSRHLPGELVGVPDFWLIDDRHVIVMRYDDRGRFLGGELSSNVRRYQRARGIAVAASQMFHGWWAAHPELHRTRRAA